MPRPMEDNSVNPLWNPVDLDPRSGRDLVRTAFKAAVCIVAAGAILLALVFVFFTALLMFGGGFHGMSF